MFQVKVKWNKLTFDNVPLDTTKTVDDFKEEIRKLTNVPKDRQKLMAKGGWTGTLKDDQDLTAIKATEGMQVMLMGSAETVAAVTTPVTFFEDLTTNEQAKTGALLPAGMSNLGNTCYMNATLQCLRYVRNIGPVLDRCNNDGLLRSLKALLTELDSSGAAVVPYGFVANLRRSFQQFAEMSNGRYMQQDAEEFLGVILSSMERSYSESGGDYPLALNFEEVVTCEESVEEPPVRNVVRSNKLICNIQGGAGSAIVINYMHEGIRLGLEGSIEKYSERLGRNANWKRVQKLLSLPDTICVQFMRFFWKANPESADHTGIKCKILRAVSFPEVSVFVVSMSCNMNMIKVFVA